MRTNRTNNKNKQCKYKNCKYPRLAYKKFCRTHHDKYVAQIVVVRMPRMEDIARNFVANLDENEKKLQKKLEEENKGNWKNKLLSFIFVDYERDH